DRVSSIKNAGLSTRLPLAQGGPFISHLHLSTASLAERLGSALLPTAPRARPASVDDSESRHGLLSYDLPAARRRSKLPRRPHSFEDHLRYEYCGSTRIRRHPACQYRRSGRLPAYKKSVPLSVF